ncbi:hypothetical protein Gpo141_00003199 [Globisporangium polare]
MQVLLAAKKKSTNIDVVIIVDNTLMHCSGSKVKDPIAGDVNVYVDLLPSFMQHHRYVLLDDRIAIHGSVNLTQHAMVSAGVLALHEDLRMVEPLTRHFANVGDHTVVASLRGSREEDRSSCWARVQGCRSRRGLLP